MVVTFLVFLQETFKKHRVNNNFTLRIKKKTTTHQSPISWSKVSAELNINSKLVTLIVSHSDNGWLNLLAPENMLSNVITLEVSHFEMSIDTSKSSEINKSI